MAMTIDQLEKLCKKEGLRYFKDPAKPILRLGARGLFGRYDFLMLLELEGNFLQFRTIGLLECPADHPHLKEVLKVLGGVNYTLRLVKFGWDREDGEIVAYADMWIVDGKLTQKQFSRICGNYLRGLDVNYSRIKQTLDTGRDVGEPAREGEGEKIPTRV